MINTEKLLQEIKNYDFQYGSLEENIDVDIEHNCKQLLYMLQNIQEMPFKIQYHGNYEDGFYYIVEYYDPVVKHHVEIYDSDFELECMFYNENDIVKLIEKLYEKYEEVKEKIREDREDKKTVFELVGDLYEYIQNGMYFGDLVENEYILEQLSTIQNYSK